MMKPSWKSSVERGRRAGGHAADVGVVGAVGDEADEGLAAGGVCPSISPRTNGPAISHRTTLRGPHGSLRGGEDGGDEGDVVEVGAAEVGVVEGDDVAGVELEALERGGDGSGHGAEVDGDVGRLRDHVALGVKEGAGVVLALLDVGGEAGAAKGDAHLLGDGGEEVLEDLEGYGVYGHFLPAPGAFGSRNCRVIVALRGWKCPSTGVRANGVGHCRRTSLAVAELSDSISEQPPRLHATTQSTWKQHRCHRWTPSLKT